MIHELFTVHISINKHVIFYNDNKYLYIYKDIFICIIHITIIVMITVNYFLFTTIDLLTLFDDPLEL